MGAIGAGFGGHGFVVFFHFAGESGVLDGLHGGRDDFLAPVSAVWVGLTSKCREDGGWVRRERKVRRRVRSEVRRQERAIFMNTGEALGD